jgi:HlyD family secretion protein
VRKVVFALSALGLLAGCAVAYLSGGSAAPLPPAFNPAMNPYANGIYASGIIESDQASGANANLYPEVSGTVKRILVSEGEQVTRGTELLALDDSIQHATVEQLQSQAQAALTQLNELRAQPRKETLDVAEAQVVSAQASAKTAQDALDKQQSAYDRNPKAVSKDALANAANALATAHAALDVARKQRDLIKAGAWSYDIENQQQQYEALTKAYASAKALLSKYTLRAPADGVVLAVNPTVGSYVSAQGAYDTYTQGMTPVIVFGTANARLHVRCYVDEILVPRLPSTEHMRAQMSLRGSPLRIPLQFVRVQPVVSPKIELSDQRLEKVDVRVLPIIFSFEQTTTLKVYPGQLVDVYIGE